MRRAGDVREEEVENEKGEKKGWEARSKKQRHQALTEEHTYWQANQEEGEGRVSMLVIDQLKFSEFGASIFFQLSWQWQALPGL